MDVFAKGLAYPVAEVALVIVRKTGLNDTNAIPKERFVSVVKRDVGEAL
jgi:hypothetical protein